jgi:hypothetical protein
MPNGTSDARELTRRLIAREHARTDASNGVSSTIYAAAEHTCRQLSRSLGPTGFDALLRRALAQAEAQHPLLKELHLGRATEPFLGGITAIVAVHGDPALTAGIEAMLETLFVLLGRLIGDDMVPRLVEQSAIATQDDEDVK